MCSRYSLRKRTKRRNTEPILNSYKPARKTRKHKYISLLQQQQEHSTNNSKSKSKSKNKNKNRRKRTATVESTHQEKQQLNLFPLHPEEKEDHNNSNVAHFFLTDLATETLSSLIWSTSGKEDEEEEEEEEEENSSCEPSIAYASKSWLERSALRGGKNVERDLSEEKWVCFEEVTSCVPEIKLEKGGGGLSLKLDYDEIMNAWSDKGPLYLDHVDGELGSHIVPDVLHDLLQHTPNQVSMDAGMVPLLRVHDDGSSVIDGIEMDAWKLRTREARLLRYKEKRQSRLFSKRIRYEVRKLNAEKRPRMKGRFVKRS
ncbi:hypothetical protein IFM89_012526 [Coptis chinensis]|uniref:CCT domain-containing protein n=1 Tax=Coptis chinensis TaxID=261450 RepID=A0A835LQ62_9MAGN|nr:hypothetical protein IFM89_012526 [Coptis chinensis]